jgi:hypothetical protein
MNEEIKKILLKSVRVLKSNGGMENKEVKPVIVNLEKLIKKRRVASRVKRA